MKSDEEAMEILEAFDLCGSFRAAAALCGCSHHTVAHHVARRGAGDAPGEAVNRGSVVDPFLTKIEEWVERSRGRFRADIAHERLAAMGYEGSERTTRRAVAEAKEHFFGGRHRVYRPWVPEPGMWFQWDYGQGPAINGRPTCLWCAWLAWSRFRVVIPIWDKTLPTVIWCLDATLRAFGGVPTYALTDNEKTVSVDHIARIAVRNAELVAASRHYGLTVATCVPADPESKGGSEATVRVAKADLVPTEANLREEYPSFAALAGDCATFCAQINARPHRETARPPAEALATERARLHPVPETPYTVAFGQTRRVSWSSTISFGGVRYSVPYRLSGKGVWVRVAGEELVIVHVDEVAGASEVARHRLSTPGNPSILDEHYPPRPVGALGRQPRATNPEEAAFLSLGDGAAAWLIEGAASGATRMRAKIAGALSLAKLHGDGVVDRALRTAATAGRFADGDLERILGYQLRASTTGQLTRPTEGHSLQAGTAVWKRLGS